MFHIFLLAIPCLLVQVFQDLNHEIQHIQHLFLNFGYPDTSLRSIFLYGGVRNSYLTCLLSKLHLLINVFFSNHTGYHGWMRLWQQFVGAVSILIKRSIRAHYRQKKRKMFGASVALNIQCLCKNSGNVFESHKKSSQFLSILETREALQIKPCFFQGVYGFSRPQLNRLYIHGLSLVNETIFIANMALVEGSCSMKLFSSTTCLQQVSAPFGGTGQLVFIQR